MSYEIKEGYLNANQAAGIVEGVFKGLPEGSAREQANSHIQGDIVHGFYDAMDVLVGFATYKIVRRSVWR